MYSAKFTILYVIAALAAVASASPVPVAAPGAVIEVVAREPLPVAQDMISREEEAKRGCAVKSGSSFYCL